MQQTLLLCTGILGLSLVLSVAVYVYGRLRIAQQTTLQKLIDHGLSGDPLWRAAGADDRGAGDLRRGVLLLGVGLAWSAVTFFIGGKAWILGSFPMAIGAVYLLLRVVDGRSR